MYLVSLILFVAATVSGGSAEPPVLTPGLVVEQHPAAGSHQAFVLDVCDEGAAEALSIKVRQRGADVVLRLVDPSGQVLATVDTPSGRLGLEVAAVPRTTAGRYRVEVDTGAVDPGGSYSLEAGLEAVTPGGADPGMLAEMALTAAAGHFLAGTADDRRCAVDELWEAAAQAGAAGRDDLLAATLGTLGVLYRGTGELAAARLVFAQAAAAWHRLGDVAGEARALNELGHAGWLAGRCDEAVQPLERARALDRAAGDPRGEARATSNLALCHLAAGEPLPARERFLEALELSRQAGDEDLEATVLNNIGGTYQMVGEPRAAIAYLERALELYRAHGDLRNQARSLTSLGAMWRALGRFQQALGFHLEALELARRLGDTRSEATALNNIGLLYLALGEPERARSFLEQALPLRRRVRDRRGEVATRNNLGQAAVELDRTEEALEHFGAALDLASDLGSRRAQAVSLDRIGSVLTGLGRFPEAMASFDRALALRREIGDRSKLARTEANIGRVLLEQGRPESALEHIERALAVPGPVDDPAGRTEALLLAGRAERALGRLEAAGQRLDGCLDLVESLRARAGAEQLRASFLAANRDMYELAMDIAMDLARSAGAGTPGTGGSGVGSAAYHCRALELSERARARSLLELLDGSDGRLEEIHRGVDEKLLTRRRSLEELLRTKAARLLELDGQPKQQRQAEAMQQELADITTRLEGVEAEVRLHSPAYAALTQPATSTCGQMQALLDPDTVLLAYSLGEERSYLWAVTSSSIDAFELPPRRQIEAVARELYSRWSTPASRDRRGASRLAVELSRMVLAPAAARLGAARLAVVADGALQYVPFAALPAASGTGGAAVDAARPLLLDHEVVSLPSVSVLAVLRQTLDLRAPAPRVVAVLADPVLSVSDPRVAQPEIAAGDGAGDDRWWESAASPGDPAPAFERLPATRAEAEAILAVAPREGSLLALGTAASRELVTGGELSRYRIVHLATHGIVDSSTPVLSALVLSMVDERGEPVDGMLRLHDIYNLELAADLVVLSGCETALGREVRGEGLVGLTRGFMYAGAARVVASLWQVRDRATSELMAHLYRAMLADGARPAAALRSAQLAMLADPRWRDPYYWAVFVLHGDWR